MKVLKLTSKEFGREFEVADTWEAIALQKKLSAEAGHHIYLDPEWVEVEEPLTSRGEKFEDLRRALRSEWEPWIAETEVQSEEESAGDASVVLNDKLGTGTVGHS